MSKRRKRYQWLADVINERGYMAGAEIGAATGNTTKHLLNHCPTLKELFAIDDWRPIPESPQWAGVDMKSVFLNKIGGDRRVIIYEGLSWDMAHFITDGCLDFVFIDASHDKDSVMKDLHAWIPKVRPGGMISGHDTHFPGVIEALTELKIPYQEIGIDHCWAWMK